MQGIKCLLSGDEALYSGDSIKYLGKALNISAIREAGLEDFSFHKA